VFTAILIFMLPVLPVLVPATITAFHALAKLCRRPARAHAVRERIEYAVEPIPASA
jgi:hypothetical protein